jgi:cysteine desulfurase
MADYISARLTVDNLTTHEVTILNNIYLDNAASMKPRNEAIDAFNSVIKDNFANPSALHKGGIDAERVITWAKASIGAYLPNSGKGGEVVFTSGATESNNLAVTNSVKARTKKKIVTTAVEHPSVANVINKFALDYEIVRVMPHADILSAIDENTSLVSMTAVCAETGRIVANPTNCAIIKARFPHCIIHVDASQGFLKIPVDGDIISISGHKIGGIPGIGALFIKDGVRVNPMFFGGDQQKSLRPGTEPTALIAAFASAVNCGAVNVQPLHDRLVAGLGRLNLKILSSYNIPNIVSFACGVKSEVMLHFFAENGIYVSSGSACARGKKSVILPAYGIPEPEVDTAIRVSFGWHNTVQETDKLLEVLETGLNRWK